MILCCLFFFQIFFRVYNFFIFVHTCQWTYQSFFLNFRFFSRKSQSQQKQPKKITHFIIQFRLKNLTHLMNLNLLDIENNMLSQYSQKLFWLYYKFSANMFLSGVRKNICIPPFLYAKTWILETLWKQMSVNFCIFP